MAPPPPHPQLPALAPPPPAPPTHRALAGGAPVLGCVQGPHPTAAGHQPPVPTGLFEPGDMKYEVYRDPGRDPSLMEMTEAALRVLSRNPRGFYLFVEGEWGQPGLSRAGRDSGQVPHHPPPPWSPCRGSY